MNAPAHSATRRRQDVAAEIERIEAEIDRRVAALERALAIKTLSGCVKYLWPIVGKGELIWGRHHDIVCDEIDATFAEADRRRALHGRIMEESATRDEAEARVSAELDNLPQLILLIEIPPRSLKSTIVSKVLPAKRWLEHSGEQFLSISTSDKNMIRDGLALRDAVTSDRYKRLIDILVASEKIDGPFEIRADQSAKSKFDTTDGGSRNGVSMGSRFVGADSDVTIIDDPHDVDDAMRGTPEQTDRRMQADIGTYRDKITDRENNPLWHVTICVMQPVHLNDLGAYLARNGAKVIRFAAEFDPDDPLNHPNDWRTEPGELLDPIRLPKRVLERKRSGEDGESGGEYAYNTKYLMRRSLKEAGRIKASWFEERYTCQPDDIAAGADEVWVTVDSNVKGGASNCDTSIQTWAMMKGKRYLLGRIARPMSPMEHDQVIDGVVDHWAPHIRRTNGGVYVEDAANGAQYIQSRRSKYPFVVDFSPTRDTPGKDKSKAARADYFIRAAESLVVILPHSSVAPWVGAFVERLVGWPMIGRDEMDAASQLHMRWTLQGVESDSSSFDDFAGFFG